LLRLACQNVPFPILLYFCNHRSFSGTGQSFALQKKSVIQKVIAVVLLLVFTISVTPGHLFHDVLTSHSDEQVCRDQDKSVPHFHNPTFHCSFDELVITAPFLGDVFPPVIQQPPFVISHNTSVPGYHFSTTFRHTESRGPPLI
jgi:hypothetical protein